MKYLVDQLTGQYEPARRVSNTVPHHPPIQPVNTQIGKEPL